MSTSDSTPTAVTVSDRMRMLVEEYTAELDAWWVLEPSKSRQREKDKDVRAKRDEILREIGTLEAKLAACCPTCRGVHSIDVSEFYPPDAPADETREVHTTETAWRRAGVKVIVDDESPTPPQTRGEAMPEYLKDAKDYARYQNHTKGGKLVARLLTALEEKEKELKIAIAQQGDIRHSRQLQYDAAMRSLKEVCDERDNLRLERERLTAAAVLQKEELEQAKILVAEQIDFNACALDHHGYCQEHGWLSEGECWQPRAKRFLSEAPPQ